MKNSVQGALDVRIDIRIPDYYTPLNMSLEREHADPIESTDKLQTPFAEKYRAGYLGERTRRNEDGTETTYYGLLCSVFMFLEKTTPQPKEDTSPSSPEEAVFIRTKRIG